MEREFDTLVIVSPARAWLGRADGGGRVGPTVVRSPLLQEIVVGDSPAATEAFRQRARDLDAAMDAAALAYWRAGYLVQDLRTVEAHTRPLSRAGLAYPLDRPWTRDGVAVAHDPSLEAPL